MSGDWITGVPNIVLAQALAIPLIPFVVPFFERLTGFVIEVVKLVCHISLRIVVVAWQRSAPHKGHERVDVTKRPRP